MIWTGVFRMGYNDTRRFIVNVNRDEIVDGIADKSSKTRLDAELRASQGFRPGNDPVC